MNNLIFIFALFGLLAVMGMPVSLSMLVSSLVTIVFFMDVPLIIVIEKLQLGVDSFLLVAVPLFILAANIMNYSGVTSRIYDFARAICGFLPGGLGHANVVGSVVFAGMSGSAVADSASLGKMEIREMVRAGYPKPYSAAMTAASATIGPVTPPSIPMVIYAGIASVSVGKMFLGGIVPGLLIAIILMILNHFYAVKNNFPRDERLSFVMILKTLWKSIPALMAPVIILGGIVLGICTPTEAAAIAVFYALILGFFVYRELKVSMIPKIIMETTVTTGVILFLISCASLFGWVLTVNRLGAAVAAFAANISTPLMFMIVINIILIFLGMIMEETAILIVMTPFLVPVVQSFGIDVAYFGVIMVLNLMISLATPPLGATLFATCQVSNLKIEELSKAMIPFVIAMLGVMLLTIIFPQLVMWLPSLIA